jgi:serine/threonine protein kinase
MTIKQSTQLTKSIKANKMQMNDDKIMVLFAATVGEKADAAMKRFDEETTICHGKGATPRFSWNELRTGKLLGSGGFNSVYEVYIPVRASPNHEESMSSPTEEEQSTCSAGTHGGIMDGPYAIKSLKHSLTRNSEAFLTGAVDLVYEAKLLSVLNHRNIIKIHGIPKGRVSDSYLGGGYFIIMEKLVGTVEDKIVAWRHGLELYSLSRTCTKPGSRDEIIERLKNIAIPVAEAMKYLHSKRVIFRDLKPSNIGLDQHGTIKLFDLGLAREITDPNRLMTGCTGSRR